MILIKISQGENCQYLPLVKDRKEAINLINQIPYVYTIDEEYEYGLSFEKLPDYFEIKLGEALYPLSRFSFADDEEIVISLIELENMADIKGLAEGLTKVDAYVIDNKEAKRYIELREQKYSLAKAMLKKRGFEAERSYYGSQDGEAIIITKGGESHFLWHMDPFFVEESPDNEADFEKYIDEGLKSYEI